MKNELAIDLENVLNQHDVLDYNTWPHVIIDHSDIPFDKNALITLRNTIPGGDKASGIYIYTYTDENNNTRVLYVGKSKTLPKRLFNHYKERYGLAGIRDWPKFWGSYKHVMKVYYKTINDDSDSYIDEALRIIVERWLIAKLKPLSENTFKSIK
jgi:predicted GIY-YIG superfamily endonuclease